MQYIHYGHTEYDRKKFKPIKNRFYFSKPDGGLWASPIDTEWGWKDWCEAESFCECSDNNSFRFILSHAANVCHINTCTDAMKLPQIKQGNAEWSALMRKSKQSYPDFEKMLLCGTDAIFFNMSNDHELYWALYGWDCDSLVVLNPEVIVFEANR